MVLQGKAATTVQVPTTQAELTGLMVRRSELADQLREVSNQRQQLVGERFSAQANQNQAVVAELDARIKSLTDRIARLEAEKLAADDAVAASIGKVAQVEGQPVLAPPALPTAGVDVPGFPGEFGPALDPGRTDREIARIGAFTVIVLALIAWRWAKGRSADAKRVKELSVESQATKDLRVAVETIAVEVERISENQRFITKLISEKQRSDPALIERGRGDRS